MSYCRCPKCGFGVWIHSGVWQFILTWIACYCPSQQEATR